MLGNKLQRMIFFELLRVFALALLALTGMFLMGGLIQEASQRGLTPSQIIAAIPLLIPSTLPYTVPATTLFAACTVYGRLAADNEITAIKSAGVHLMTLLWPGVTLGLLTSSATMALSYDFIPRTHLMMRAQVVRDLDEYLYAMLKRESCIRSPKVPYAIFVREVHGRKLTDAIFKKKRADGTYSLVAHAKEAELLQADVVEQKMAVFMKSCSVAGDEEVAANFQDRTFDMPLPVSELRENGQRATDMTCPQIITRREELREELVGRLADVEALRAEKPPTAALITHRDKRLENAEYHVRETAKAIRFLNAELHMRPALSFGCLCFALVGAPVGVWFARSDYLSAFVSCFLPIVFAYYPLLLCGSNLAKDGRLPAEVALWLANGLLVVAGLGLSWRLLRH